MIISAIELWIASSLGFAAGWCTRLLFERPVVVEQPRDVSPELQAILRHGSIMKTYCGNCDAIVTVEPEQTDYVLHLICQTCGEPTRTEVHG